MSRSQRCPPSASYFSFYVSNILQQKVLYSLYYASKQGCNTFLQEKDTIRDGGSTAI